MCSDRTFSNFSVVLVHSFSLLRDLKIEEINDLILLRRHSFCWKSIVVIIPLLMYGVEYRQRSELLYYLYSFVVVKQDLTC